MKRIYKNILSLVMVTVICMQYISVPQKVQAASAGDPVIGEIRLFAGNFAPKGWAFCNGQLLNINQNTALFSILGTTYGGDGKSTFALPDLNGRVAIGAGQGPGLSDRLLGEIGGPSGVKLTESEMPSHSHGGQRLKFDVQDAFGTVRGSSGKGVSPIPGLPLPNTVFASGLRNERIYSTGTATDSVNMMEYSAQVNKALTITANTSSAGGDFPHNNMSPYLTLNYIICLQGVYPSKDGSGDGGSYIGEIRMFAGDFEPNGMLICDGRSLRISDYEVLFQVIGTTYGGDGETTFNLPDLRGRAPIGMGAGTGLSSRIHGEMGGVEQVTLTRNQIPAHSHTISQQITTIKTSGDMKVSKNKGDQVLPERNVLAVGSRNERIYSNESPNINMKQDSFLMDISLGADDEDCTSNSVGGSQPHDNMMPYTAINYVINPFGIFPGYGSSGSSNNIMGCIEMYAFNFETKGTAVCNGQLLPINQNQAFYSILGTTYGGNGTVNFALPNLSGRMPLGVGGGHGLGEAGGSETHTLTIAEMPVHYHTLSMNTTITGSGTVIGTNSPGNSASPVNGVLSRGFKNERIYAAPALSDYTMVNSIDVKADINITPLDTEGNPIIGDNYLSNTGASQPHENMMPYSVITFAIVIQGVYPSRD